MSLLAGRVRLPTQCGLSPALPGPTVERAWGHPGGGIGCQAWPSESGPRSAVQEPPDSFLNGVSAAQVTGV